MDAISAIVILTDFAYVLLIAQFVVSAKDKATKIGFNLTMVLFIVNMFLIWNAARS